MGSMAIQQDGEKGRTVRIRADVYEYLRERAFKERTTIIDLLDMAARKTFKLPPFRPAA